MSETWRDWLPADWPEPAVITRAELLAQLAARGAPVDERLLRYWEQQGASPRPVRRSHQGQVQALYPAWMADVVIALHAWRATRRLRSIIPLARLLFVDIARSYHQPESATWHEDWRPPDYVVAALARYLIEEIGAGGAVMLEVRPSTGATCQWSQQRYEKSN